MIPELRAAFDSALSELGQALVDLRNRLPPGRWLGDETSAAVAAHYTRRAMEQPDSSYRALLEYRGGARPASATPCSAWRTTTAATNRPPPTAYRRT